MEANDAVMVLIPKKRRQMMMGINDYRGESHQPSNRRTRDSVRSLRHLTASYSKRRGPTHFSYATTDKDIADVKVVAERSPYQACLDCLNGAKKWHIDGLNCDDDWTRTSDDRVVVERSIRALNRVMNDRVSSLWSIKEGMSTRMIHVAFVQSELRGTASLYSKLLRVMKATAAVSAAIPFREQLVLVGNGTVTSRRQYVRRVLILLDDSLKRLIPQYYRRLQSYVRHTVWENISFGLNQLLTIHRSLFVIPSQQQRPLLNFKSVNSAWSRAGSSAKSSAAAMTEQQLCRIVKYAIESLDRAFVQLCEHSARVGWDDDDDDAGKLMDLEYMRALNAEDRDLYALTADCSLASLLDCLSEHPSAQQFNELGVHMLLRVIEQLQSVVVSVKQRMQWPVVVSDLHVWRRADRVLRVLGCCCCAQEAGSGDRGGVDSLMSRAEEQRWRSKVKPPRQSICCRPAKGSSSSSSRVFVKLELQYDNL